MSESVEVPFGDNPSETATLLLAAAEELGIDQSVVQTNSEGAFVVPEKVRDKAFSTEKKAPAKKAAAKKSTKSKE